ncbi:THAP-type domain-containing protein [Aphis craccivora]|uniref:THAP-type domain-containing protein n=1 Tax=Aphis craccivora TaxID=307492 RepID=A0A6G0VTX7_APHCR|nr:THAP-type domain-containing protein [Aphis craccivora]
MQICRPECQTLDYGYDYRYLTSKTTFGDPKNIEERNKWENALKTVLKKSYRVCASHFKESDIKSTWESGEGENKYIICLKVPKLLDGAIPSVLFKNDENCQIETKRRKRPVCLGVSVPRRKCDSA